MKSLVRQVVLLVTSVTVFLTGLGVLLWSSNMGIARHIQHGNDFLAPSQLHVAQAQHIVARLAIEVHSDGLSPRPPGMVPYRFHVAGALDELERHLTRVVRLAHAFNYQDALNLPTRAFQHYETARAAFLSLDELTPQQSMRLLAVFEPLRGTLDQLARIYELEERNWHEEQERFTARYFKLAIFGIALLVLVLLPLVFRLAIGLRHNVRRELRTRQELEEANQNLEEMAIYDNLTKLGNRHLFKTRLDQVIGSAKRSDRLFGLMYIDLDNFKRINDSLGHDAGDEVLTVVAARLAGCVRSADTVARLGGDEFTVIITDMDNNGNAATVADKILRQVKRPINVAGNEVVVSASIGITIVPTDGDDATVLMKNADLALYKAKEHGRDNFQFFVEAMNRAAVAQMAMENALRAAVRDEKFALHYQPQVDLYTGKVTYAEALLRWPQGKGKMIPPNEFIPLADANGLLNEIGAWVLTRACRDLARMRRNGAPDLRISINLSPGQFRDPKLVARVQEALRVSALAPPALEIEITESTLIADTDATVKILNALRDLGITVAIDDFGVGYSSLNYLKNLPIDALKIDQSFVRDMEKNETDRSIVDAILYMARSFSLRTVAEGIENKWQLDHLISQRCDEGQGFLFSRPVPADEFSPVEMSRQWSSTLAPGAHSGLRVVE